MNQHWFMKPSKSKTGGAIDQGVQNEDQVIARLPKYLKQMSRGVFSIHKNKVREFGLLARRDCNACTTSPDGVFLMMKTENGTTKPYSLCVLEIKTRGSVNTLDGQEARILQSGSWLMVDAGTDEFKKSIPEPAYRSQVCQHAAATGINTVLLVYCVPGALIKQMVMVNVSEDHCCTILERQSRITEKYLSFAYDANNLRDVPSLGKDFSPAYGYAQEHKTLCS